MKILFLSHSANNPNAGASSIYHMLGEGLQALGHHVTSLHKEDMDLPTQRFHRRIAHRFTLPQHIKRRALREDIASYDVIMNSNGTAWPLFQLLRPWVKRPLLVTHYHGLSVYDRIANLTEATIGHHSVSNFYRLMGATYDRWDMAGFANSDLAIVQNLRDLSFLEKRTPSGTSLMVIPPAVSASLLSLTETITPLTQRTVRNIITFSSWGARKGSFYLAGILRRIRSRFPDVRLLVGGTQMKPEVLLPLFAEEDRDAVEVLPYLTREQQAKLYNESGIFLFPSYSEGFGLALLEAQICGLAAVTTNTGYGGDFLTDRLTARVVPLTTEHLAQGVISLLEDDALRCNIAEQGRKLARQFNLATMSRAYETAFSQTILESRSNRRNRQSV